MRGLTVYVLRSLSESRHYVGLTSNLRRRLGEHNTGSVGHTSAGRPWTLVVAIYFPDRDLARAFERYLETGSGRAFAKRHFGDA